MIFPLDINQKNQEQLVMRHELVLPGVLSQSWEPQPCFPYHRE